MSIELEALSPPPSPAFVARPARAPRPRARALSRRLSVEDWERLEPRGLYARALRPVVLALATATLLPVALSIALPVALVNLFLHGPRRIFFTQLRAGRRGRVFVIYKFRTLRDRPGGDEARATRFGRFLRNTHLDELPQLLNVLRGDMSLIGPRPEMLSTERWAARHCPGFSERLVLRPGLTGLAQVSQGYIEGGDVEGYRRKLALNRSYREELSLALDCSILLRTVLWMLRGRGWRRSRRRSRRDARRRSDRRATSSKASSAS